jgi:hypothetical protein
LTVNPACTAPSVTTQPSDQSITYGANASFTAAASGTSPTVQWQVSTNGGATYSDLSGQTSTTLTLTKPPVSASANRYHAVFTNGCGSATSDAATLTVAAKNLTITGAVAESKPYDATDNATIDWSVASLSGVVGSDDVSIVHSSYSAHFDNKNVGTDKPVTVTGVTLGGGDAGNYTLSQPSGLKADIDQAPLDIYAVSDSKPYDGTTSSSGVPTVSGLQTGDTVTGKSQAFQSKNVLGAGNSTLVVTAYTLNDGNSGGNYDVTTHTASGTITKKDLTVSGITASNKLYDGNTTATLNVSGASLVGVVGLDTVNLNTGAAAGTFASKEVGTWTVTISGLTISGADSGNYNLIQPTTTASIGAWNAVGYGFYAPVGVANSIFTAAPASAPNANPGEYWNTAKGGSTVPLKFNVYAGTLEKTSLSDIKSFQTAKLASCAGGLGDDAVDITTTGGTSLRYDTTAMQWIQNWKTPSANTDTCYRAWVTFADNSSIEAFFKLKR